MSGEYDKAREELIAVVDRLKASWDADPSGYSEAETQYSDELVALAARDLYHATEALPRDSRPVGWNARPKNAALPVPLTELELTSLIMLITRDLEGESLADAPEPYKALLWKLTQERYAFYRWPEDKK